MSQPVYPDQRTGYHSDTITAARGEDALTTALHLVQAFRQANPDYTGPVGVQIGVTFQPAADQP